MPIRGKPQVFGYAQTSYGAGKGRGRRRSIDFSEVGKLVLRFRDPSDKPLSGLMLEVQLPNGDVLPSGGSDIELANVPLASRWYWMRIREKSGYWRLQKWTRTVHDGTVILDIVLKKLDTPLTEPYWMSWNGGDVRFHGAPVERDGLTLRPRLEWRPSGPSTLYEPAAPNRN